MAEINIEELARAFALGLKDATDAANAFAEEERIKNKAKNEYEVNVKKAQDAAITGLREFHGALTNTTGGMTKYNSAISSFGTALSTASALLLPFGKTIGLLITGVTKATEAVVKQNEAILKSYNELGQFGATLNLTTDDVLELGKTAGYTSHNLESFYKNVNVVGSGLVTLGGTTSEGIKKFSELAKTTEAQRNAMRRLGFSQEEVTEMQAHYVKQLSLTGGTLAKTPKQLGEESRKYIEQLSKLAELTGNNVKEQQKGLELAQANENFNAYIYTLEQKRINASTKAEQEALDKQIASTKAMGAWANTTLDAKNAMAFLETMTNETGEAYSDSNIQLQMLGINTRELNRMAKEGVDPQKIIMRAMSEFAQGSKRVNSMFGENIFRLQENSKNLQGIFGYSNEVRKLALEALRFEKMTDEEKKDFLEKQLNVAKKTQTIIEGRLELENEIKESEKEYRTAMDEMTLLTSGPINSMLTVFAKSVSMVARTIRDFGKMLDGLGNAIKWVLKKLGINTESKTESGSAESATPAMSSSTGDLSGVGILGEGESVAPTPAPAAPTVTPSRTSGGPVTEVPATKLSTQETGKKPTTFYEKMYDTLLVEATKAGLSNPEAIAKLGAAQASLETGNGRSAPGNNYFGIKARPGEEGTGSINTQEFENGQMVTKKQKFRSYGSMSESAADYIKFLRENKRYQGVLAASTVEEAIMAQGKTGYATDPEYAKKLMRIAGIPQAANGGMFSGPTSGFPVMLHGNEAVIPLDPESLITKLMNTKVTDAASGFNTSGGMSSGMEEMINLLANKLDDVIYALSTSNNTQEEMLRYART